jgi:hypothetical protein
VGFFGRLLSSDYRRALEAEAAGDLVLAGRLYARAGLPIKVAEVHLARALRIGHSDRGEALAQLRSAAGFCPRGTPPLPEASALLVRIATALGGHARNGAPTARVDQALLREAAALYEAAQAPADAAACLEEAGDLPAAAELYGRAGEIAKMEALLDREQEAARGQAALREAWDQFQMELAVGRRAAARAALARLVASPHAGAQLAEYMRLLEDLTARWLDAGCVRLRAGEGAPVTYAGGFPVWLGRDEVSGLSLRERGVSRRHARVSRGEEGRLVLEDCGSRNGTRLGGIPLAAPIALGDEGELALGDDCEIGYRILSAGDGALRLSLDVRRGMDRGARLEASEAPHQLGASVELAFAIGRPIARRAGGGLSLGGVPAAPEIELLRGDRFGAEDRAWEVL